MRKPEWERRIDEQGINEEERQKVADRVHQTLLEVPAPREQDWRKKKRQERDFWFRWRQRCRHLPEHEIRLIGDWWGCAMCGGKTPEYRGTK